MRRSASAKLWLFQVLSLGGALTILATAVITGVRGQEEPPEVVADGVVVKQSPYSVEETESRFIAILEEKELNIFATVDHAENATNAELELRPTRVVMFGNPKLGTPLMQCAQSIAIDLPQKMLIWEDEAGDTKIAYNDPQYLAERHGLGECESETIEKISGALDQLSGGAIAP
ncbi:MAG: DUF302 domain-containing protein [Phormidesmis sp.]